MKSLSRSNEISQPFVPFVDAVVGNVAVFFRQSHEEHWLASAEAVHAERYCVTRRLAKSAQSLELHRCAAQFTKMRSGRSRVPSRGESHIGRHLHCAKHCCARAAPAKKALHHFFVDAGVVVIYFLCALAHSSAWQLTGGDLAMIMCVCLQGGH